jgi:DNA-binding MarR family transcriptional regulator
LIAMIRRRLNLAYSESLRPFRVTTRQYGVLSRLWAAPEGLSLDALVARLHTDQSSLSRVVDRMVRAGLLRRVVDPADRRARRLTLSPRGRALAAPLRRIGDAHERRLVAGLSAAERGRVARDLSRLLDNLEAPRAGRR